MVHFVLLKEKEIITQVRDLVQQLKCLSFTEQKRFALLNFFHSVCRATKKNAWEGPAISARGIKVLSPFRWRYSYSDWRRDASLLFQFSWLGFSVALNRCVKPWQAINHILTQAGAKLALVLVCEMDTWGYRRTWVLGQPRAGEQESQHHKSQNVAIYSKS